MSHDLDPGHIRSRGWNHPKMGDSDSRVGLKPEVDSIFSQFGVGVRIGVNYFYTTCTSLGEQKKKEINIYHSKFPVKYQHTCESVAKHDTWVNTSYLLALRT